MFNRNDLRIFLTQNNDPASFNLWQTLTTLSYYLNARVTLIDNSGSILFVNDNTNSRKNENTIQATKRISVSTKGNKTALLTIEKTKFSQLENVLIEMVSGIINTHVH